MIGYSFTKRADQELRKLPFSSQRLIIKKIKHYCATDNPLQFADSIEGQKGKVYRFRIGDYRAIFDWESDRLLIIKVAKRSEAYQK